MSAFGTCDSCGGPAWWCLDLAGDPWEKCQDDSCSQQSQLELFPEEPIWEERVVPFVSGHEADDHVSETHPNKVRTSEVHNDVELPF